jgi:hypothetical protein
VQRASPHSGHLVTRGHHQGGFAGLVHAAEPAGVVAQLLFTDAIILPDLHRLAAARARIALAGDDDVLPSLPLPAQCAPVSRLARRQIFTHRLRLKPSRLVCGS